MLTSRHLSEAGDHDTAIVAGTNREWTPASVWAAWAIIALGTLARLIPYLANRSLWLDEAALALNIVERPYRSLIRPLDYGQSAPPGFVLLAKLPTSLLGDNEFALRLIPLLGGVLALVLFYQLARRCLRPSGVLIALALFAFSQSLIYYASEVKPYSTDVTATIAILLVGLMLLQSRGNFLPFLWFGMVGAIAVLISFSSVFVLSGFALIAIPNKWLRGERRNAAVLLVLVAVLMAIFRSTYLLCASPNPDLYSYWHRGFVPAGSGSIKVIRWLLYAPLSGMDRDALGLGPFWLATAAFIFGVAWFWRDARWRLAALLSPIVMTFIAALLHAYPMLAGRLVLFLVPLYLIVIAAGLDFIWRSRWRAGPYLAVLLIAVLLIPALRSVGTSLRRSPGHEEIKPVLDLVVKQGKTGDVVYVYGMAQYAFTFYARYSDKYHLPEMIVVKGRPRTTDAALYAADLRPLVGQPRVWIVMSHSWHWGEESDGYDDADVFRAILDRMGTRLSEIQVDGASGYLYDLRQHSAR